MGGHALDQGTLRSDSDGVVDIQSGRIAVRTPRDLAGEDKKLC